MLTKVCGFYKLEAIKITNGVPHSRRSLTGWFPNLITNQGLDRMALNYDYVSYCQVGSGSTVPANSDIGLVNIIAGVSILAADTSQGINSTSPYYSWYKRIARFGEGVAAGNLSEIGMGWASTGNTLFSRALILDTYGNPTTITVLSDEYLEVTYELRFYPIETDVTGSITFTGNIGGTYSYTLRRALITTTVAQAGVVGYIYPVSMSNRMTLNNNYSFLRAYTGSMGAIDGIPTGTVANGSHVNQSISPYVSGSYSLDLICSMGPSYWNLSGGIRSIQFTFGFSNHQMEFDTAIPKTNQDSLSLTFRHTWARV